MASKEAIQSFFRAQAILGRIRLADMANDLHLDYQKMNQVMSGFKKSPETRVKLAQYMGFETWEELEAAAEKAARYNLRTVPHDAPIRNRMEVSA